MAKFSKNNFRMIIHEIEDMEAADQNIWVPIGILEYMFEDDIGHIDKYFNQDKNKRDMGRLYDLLQAPKINVTPEIIKWSKTTTNNDGVGFLRPDPLRGWTWN